MVVVPCQEAGSLQTATRSSRSLPSSAVQSPSERRRAGLGRRAAAGAGEDRCPGEHVLGEVADGPALAGHGSVEVVGGRGDEGLVRRGRGDDEVRAGREVGEHGTGR